MTEHEVVIAGGGPTGLMLAAELALAGTDVLIVERRADQSLDGSRAGGLHARTIEVLDQRGVAERFLAAGQAHPAVGFNYVPLAMSDLPSRHNHLLALRQPEVERILAEWVLDELGVAIRRSCEVVGVAQDDDGVDVELSDESSLRAAFLVGCDGGRSVVRKAAGIEFPGLPPSASWMVAEALLRDPPPPGVRPEGGGIGPVDPGAPDGRYRMVVREREAEHEDDPTLPDLIEALAAVYGTDFGVHEPTWISRFSDMARQAATYRHGRVLVAGDAAHVHPPQGGQGLNVGVQDAVNLGWKLAQVARGISPDSLLDTYHAERHPVGARVLQNTSAQVALATADDRHPALREMVAELLAMDEPRRRFAAMLAGLDIHYDLGDGHPLLGRRMPDLDLETADGPTRVYALLHEARTVLLVLGDADGVRDARRDAAVGVGEAGGRDGFDLTPWANRVATVEARSAGPLELPLLGEVPTPPAVLIRPDGHVAWTGRLTDPTLLRALEHWFGGALPG